MATTGLLLKLTKTYRVHPDTYLLDCTLNLENRTGEEQKVQYDLTGPVGLEYEGLSTDMRNVVAAFRTPQGEVTSVRLTVQALAKATTPEKRSLTTGRSSGETFLWAAAVNRYFAAVVVPVPSEPNGYADWIAGKWGTYYDLNGNRRGPGRNTIGVQLASTEVTLKPAGQPENARSFPFNALPRAERQEPVRQKPVSTTGWASSRRSTSWAAAASR